MQSVIEGQRRRMIPVPGVTAGPRDVAASDVVQEGMGSVISGVLAVVDVLVQGWRQKCEMARVEILPVRVDPARSALWSESPIVPLELLLDTLVVSVFGATVAL
ncbi:hypothetical protein [Streptomyces rhizosphaericus]|uniref:hypothetical protein n=1 Tax=Streptomyces rhizosphaericus TaxID=114699 RepID=UPI00117E6AB3|nr:hypothetical protein [Streptomyces rhizosphaericus]